jgi:penicillin-binding protein 1A
MTAAYASFLNGGLQASRPRSIETIRASARGRCCRMPAPARVIDPDLAAMMVRMMAAVVARGTGTAAALPGRLVVGKSGTTQDYARRLVRRRHRQSRHRRVDGQRRQSGR